MTNMVRDASQFPLGATSVRAETTADAADVGLTETLAASRCIIGKLRKCDWQAVAVNGKVVLARRRRGGTYPPGLGHASGITKREGCTVQ